MDKLSALRDVLTRKGVTFAGVDFVTEVPTAAKFRDSVKITKRTVANVQLFARISEFTDVWSNAVKRSAGGIEGNSPEAVAAFETQSNYFEHTEVFSIVKHKADPTRFYLYAIFNSASSEFFINGVAATRDEVVQYLTPSEAKKLQSDGTVRNVTHDITHRVTVRTIKLENVQSVRTEGQVLDFA